jgi:glycosyltransferase involved in cell wall biosynthesis
MLIEAFAALGDARAHLIIAGEGSLKQEVAGWVERRGLQTRIHLLGRRHDIPSILAGSDAFVLASDWEGNPLAVMEAMAAGLPVISTAVGGVPELVQSGVNGILVPRGDRLSLTLALRTLLDDPAKRHAQAAAAREHALRAFTVERMVQGYSTLYRNALGKLPQIARTVTAA